MCMILWCVVYGLCQVMVRRLKSEVLSELPAKIRQRVVVEVPKDKLKVGDIIHKRPYPFEELRGRIGQYRTLRTQGRYHSPKYNQPP